MAIDLFIKGNTAVVNQKWGAKKWGRHIHFTNFPARLQQK